MKETKICAPTNKNGNSGNKNNFCGKEKILDEFVKNRNQCKDCRSNYRKIFYQENREKIIVKEKARYKEHKENILAQKKKYYRENREKIIAKRNLYYRENKEKIQQYRAENKEKIQKCKKRYREANKEKLRQYHKEYSQINKEKLRQYIKNYRRENPDKIRKYDKKYYNSKRKKNPVFKFKKIISGQAKIGFKNRKIFKNNRSFWANINYTPEEGRLYIENLWEPWMCWENHGHLRKDFDPENIATWTWQIDHIIPQSKFNFKDFDDEFKKCWNLENLQPLRADLNCKKGNKDWDEFKKENIPEFEKMAQLSFLILKNSLKN